MSSQPTDWGRSFVPAPHGVKRRVAGWLLALAGLFVLGLGLAAQVSPDGDSSTDCGRAYLILGTGETTTQDSGADADRADLDEACTSRARSTVALPAIGGTLLVVAGLAVLIHLRREERELRNRATRP
ncbi:hypothetical protein ASD11_15440 [Aeromicrobium sp. Root495]|uniref:hypothetical protein n=1 Tax=Aeromicrobium sp. Root495 TaxID=1736550 RepID=UPI0006FC37F3|nr:hypothetical protein [Aeromicrobium sp. Root495]KQY55887.1 hypothetical protein ASD11_15440 [Aeromicrobium sp. Root495]